MKPLIIYVDDEPHNLTVFEAAMPAEWEILTFDSPLIALEKINNLNPWVVLSDQRMPSMNGVSFLEIVKKISPQSVRAIVTGFSEEDLVVESIRKAHIFDYIRKPWDVEDLVHRVNIMVDNYSLERELKEKSSQLLLRNQELEKLNNEILEAKEREVKLRKELEAWAPPFITETFSKGSSLKFPRKADLAVMTYDIIQSSKLHGLEYQNRPIHAHILDGYTQCIIHHGGWRESSSGDSAYAHFGIIKTLEHPANSAFAAATEFRVYLRNLAQNSGINFECGIAIHFAPECVVDIHEIKTQAFGQDIIHKSFQSSSIEIDLVHRMEKIMHELPGSNIAMSRAFVDKLVIQHEGMLELGIFQLKGQIHPIEIIIKPSYFTKEFDINRLRISNGLPEMKISS